MRQSWEEDLKCIVSGPEGVFYPLEIEAEGRRAVRIAMDTIREAVGRNGDFEVDFSGSYFSNLNMVREMIMILLVSLVLLYLILASQFESLVQPLIILSEIVTDLFSPLPSCGYAESRSISCHLSGLSSCAALSSMTPS